MHSLLHTSRLNKIEIKPTFPQYDLKQAKGSLIRIQLPKIIVYPGDSLLRRGFNENDTTAFTECYQKKI